MCVNLLVNLECSMVHDRLALLTTLSLDSFGTNLLVYKTLKSKSLKFNRSNFET